MNDARIQAFVDAIAGEVRKQQFDAIRSFWRIGDAVHALRAESCGRGWLKALEGCAKRLGMHPASLDEARRASAAFPAAAREGLLGRFEQRNASLTPSHVVVLARVPPAARKRGIEILLEKSLSVRELRGELRSELRSDLRDGHRNRCSRVGNVARKCPPKATNRPSP